MKKIVVIGAAVIILAGGGAGGYFFLNRGGDEAPREVTPPAELHVGELTTNLADASGRRLIQVEVGLVISDPAPSGKKGHGDGQEGLTEIKDAIIGVLRSKTLANVSGAEGMKHLKEDIKNRVNEVVEDGEVVDVLFSKYLVQ